jgi:hypothetical protein
MKEKNNYKHLYEYFEDNHSESIKFVLILEFEKKITAKPPQEVLELIADLKQKNSVYLPYFLSIVNNTSIPSS